MLGKWMELLYRVRQLRMSCLVYSEVKWDNILYWQFSPMDNGIPSIYKTISVCTLSASTKETGEFWRN